MTREVLESLHKEPRLGHFVKTTLQYWRTHTTKETLRMYMEGGVRRGVNVLIREST